MAEDINYDTGDHYESAMDSSYPKASTSDAASGLAQAKEDKKFSNSRLGNIQVRMRGEEQYISNAMKAAR